MTIPTTDFEENTSQVGWAGIVLTGKLARDVLTDDQQIRQVMNSYLRTRVGRILKLDWCIGE